MTQDSVTDQHGHVTLISKVTFLIGSWILAKIKC